MPAAAIAGRILASQGNTPRAARVLLKTWRLSPHPDLAAAYAHARPGDSPRDRLNRVRHLARLTPHDSEGPIALAITAIEAREWDEARRALEPLLEGRLTQRVATLMARIEGGQHGHTGRVREWLARAVNAPRDPAWTADGVVSDRWAPVSPVTGALDAFRWRVPVEAIDAPAGALLAAKVEALVGLGAGSEAALEHPVRVKPAAAFAATETVEAVEQPTTTPSSAPVEDAVAPAAAQPAAEAGPADAATGPKIAQPLPAAARVAAEASPAPRAAYISPAAPADGDTSRRRAEPAAPRPAAASAPRKTEKAAIRPRKTGEPKIFVAPRAPDDPGPEPTENDGLEIGPLRPSGAKA